ncbi:hypothetical protein [Nonomuraea sp. NPDC050783]|uniref:hypothetical protein n=1 Tax=Nonomuraea sp. NPDC050783 TaxID=3154634 RepID=UPI003466F698
MNHHLRTLLGVTAAIAALGAPAALGTATAGAATAPAASAASAASTASAASVADVSRQNQPFLFTYTFAGHLKVAGGYFTTGGRVFVTVKYTTGRSAFSTWTTARPHPITPGGAVYVDTTIAAPCAGGPNGYARAYDAVTRTWSPRLPVTICQRID